MPSGRWPEAERSPSDGGGGLGGGGTSVITSACRAVFEGGDEHGVGQCQGTGEQPYQPVLGPDPVGGPGGRGTEARALHRGRAGRSKGGRTGAAAGDPSATGALPRAPTGKALCVERVVGVTSSPGGRWLARGV